MKKHILLTLLTAATLGFSQVAFAQATPPSTNSATPRIGIVDFKKCVESSKLGKAEQAAFDSLKNQMTTVVEKTQKELEEIGAILNDPEQLDSLSPEAEDVLRDRFEALNQEMANYQAQYYQILNQANYKLVQQLSEKVSEAAAEVGKSKGFQLIANKDVFFYAQPQFDITDQVIVELDKGYVEEAPAIPAPSAKPVKPAKPQAAPSSSHPSKDKGSPSPSKSQKR